MEPFHPTVGTASIDGRSSKGTSKAHSVQGYKRSTTMHTHLYERRPNATQTPHSIVPIDTLLLQPPCKVYARLIHKPPKQIRRPHNGYTRKHKSR